MRNPAMPVPVMIPLMTFDLTTLRPFLGTWRGAGEIAPNPWGGAGPCRGAWRFQIDPADRNLTHDYEETRADGSTFAGHGVWCADGDDLLHFWFDSFGFPPLQPARGRWEGDRLVMVKISPRGQGRSTWTCDGKDLSYSVEFAPAGEGPFTPVMSGTYRRVVGF